MLDISCQKGFDSEILQSCIANYAIFKNIWCMEYWWECLWCVFVCLFVSSQFIQIQYNNNMNGQCKQWFVCKCFTLISAWSLLLWLTFMQVEQYTYFLTLAAREVSGYSVKFQRCFLIFPTQLDPKSSFLSLSRYFCSDICWPSVS